MMGWLAHKSINRLRKMLQALRSGDFSLRIPVEKLRGAERKLAEDMNDIMSAFHKQLLDLERRYGQYETFLDTIDIALIVAAEDGCIKFMNRKAIDSLCGFRIQRLADLGSLDSRLPAALQSLRPGGSKALSLNNKGGEYQIKISMVKYTAFDEESYIYSIEDINRLLLENEIDSQRKLVSVITHEIMNSLSPIISLSDTLCRSDDFSEEEKRLALNTIRQRSQGLRTFVENYRKLSQIGAPNLQWTLMGEIFEGLKSLFPEPYIRFEIQCPEIQLCLDRNQIEQVIINLIKNAIDACGDQPEVIITGRPDHQKRIYLISVSDNGMGIKPEVIDNIFVPFYTTKQGGSGIGLSISRRIINAHNGLLRLDHSSPLTTFTIQLPLNYRV